MLWLLCVRTLLRIRAVVMITVCVFAGASGAE